MSKSAAKKKGLSMEEKVVKVEKWFHLHPQPYTLKELIAQVPRATGVIFQSIEECVELLVSEDRVRQEKVGVHTLFWWFPTTDAQREWEATVGTKAGQAAPAQRAADKAAAARAVLQDLPLDELEAAVVEAETDAMRLDEALSAQCSAIGTEAERQRDAAVQQAHLHDRHALQQKLRALALYDDDFVAALRTGTKTALDAANRWTDNFFLLEQHVVTTMGRSARELRRGLNVPVELDFICTLPAGDAEDTEAVMESPIEVAEDEAPAVVAVVVESDPPATPLAPPAPDLSADRQAAEKPAAVVLDTPPAATPPAGTTRKATASTKKTGKKAASAVVVVADAVIRDGVVVDVAAEGCVPPPTDVATSSKSRKRKREKA